MKNIIRRILYALVHTSRNNILCIHQTCVKCIQRTLQRIDINNNAELYIGTCQFFSFYRLSIRPQFRFYKIMQIMAVTPFPIKRSPRRTMRIILTIKSKKHIKVQPLFMTANTQRYREREREKKLPKVKSITNQLTHNLNEKPLHLCFPLHV